MKSYGYIKIAGISPKVRVGDTAFNVAEILKSLEAVQEKKPSFVNFPELAITGYSIGDLVFQNHVYEASQKAIAYLLKHNPYDGVIVIGNLFKYQDIMYNVSFVIQKDKILGIIPKYYLPQTREFHESRWFGSGVGIVDSVREVMYLGKKVPFGKLLFKNKEEDVVFGVEVCADLWAPASPHEELYANGANIIFNNSASNGFIGKEKLRQLIVTSASYKWNGAYIYVSNNASESTSEVVFTGHKIFSCSDEIVAENEPISMDTDIIYGDIDVERLHYLRQHNGWFKVVADVKRDASFQTVHYNLVESDQFTFEKEIEPLPFVPKLDSDLKRITDIQAASVIKRLEYIGINKVVLGVSGGLDSTIALLSLVYAFDKYKISRKNIIGVTLPSVNTSDLTKNSALKLMQKLQITTKELSIKEGVKQGLDIIEHDPAKKDITYENAQARYRTYLLMNLANQENAIVIGTSDMSEIALGWSTFNGDQMAMYGINSGITKTVIKRLCQYYFTEFPEVEDILQDILDTPISPELSSKDQKTEDAIGKYEINDFILYHFLVRGAGPQKIAFLLEKVFQLSTQEANHYTDQFHHRFFTQQYKRLSSPEGVKILPISLSPRTEIKLNGDIYYPVRVSSLQKD